MPRLVLLLALLPSLLLAADHGDPADGALLLRNVKIFNGVDAELTGGDVLVVGEKIAEVRAGGGIRTPKGARVIDGGGRVLSPGFIDLHAHVTFQLPLDAEPHPWVVGAVAGDALRSYLDRGFTTIRDAGGTHPDLARATASGRLVGPRVFPSGAVITQTSGHGDFRSPSAPHPTLCNCGISHTLGSGQSIIADGVPQTLAAVRENLKQGATQIKIMGGGGVASDYDPIHTLQPSPEEIRAAVQAAGDWDTYVLAHAYTAEAIRRLVDNGVQVIEHGLLIDEPTAKLCAEKDVVISTQVAIFRMGAELPGMSDEIRRKMLQVLEGQENLIRYIKQYGIRMGFGTDFVFGMYPRVAEEFTARAAYWKPVEILRQATSESAEIVRMIGRLMRYDHFGEIREGWLADLVLIEGDVLNDISLLEDPANLKLIVKAGRIHKNAL